MHSSKTIRIAAFVATILGTAYFVLFDTTFIALVIFVFLCIAWSAWNLISVFNGSDEVESASVRYALAFASCIGVPLSMAFVLLMIAMPAIQSTITFLASSARHDLDPAAAGFAMGIGFVVFMLSITLCVGLRVWWASKR